MKLIGDVFEVYLFLGGFFFMFFAIVGGLIEKDLMYLNFGVIGITLYLVLALYEEIVLIIKIIGDKQ